MNPVFGVGFLFFNLAKNEQPKIFTVKELKNKPAIFKEAGMLSFPLETHKKEDKNFEETLRRLILEEIGIPLKNSLICGIIMEKFNLIPGRPDIFTTYGYGIYLGGEIENFRPTDNDIEFSGWKTFDELLNCKIRVETKPIIHHFISSAYFQKLQKQLKQLY